MDVSMAARLGTITNLVHGFIYFAPEAAEEYEAIGLEPSQGYFASRAAPLGPVPAEIVIATFFNFEPDLVRSVIPAAWDRAAPADIQAARLRAAAQVLQRTCSEIGDESIAEASEIAGHMADLISYAGKPLAAANRAVAEPDDPWARLWQRITVVREWRGDVHVAALTAAAVSPVEALVLHAATGKVPKKALIATRQWPRDDWDGAVEALGARGLLDSDGSFTEAGEQFRSSIEHRTDAACMAMVESVGDADTSRLIELLKPVRQGLLDGGAFAMLGM